MPSPFTVLWKHRDLLSRSVSSEIRKRNAGTLFGRLWLVFTPVLLLGIYSIVYLYVFRLQPSGMSASTYVLRIFAGLVPFLAFSEALGTGVGSIIANQHLMKNTVFPIVLVPLRSVLISSPSFLVSLAIVVIAAGFVGTLKPVIAFLPAFVLLQTMFTVGLLWILSLIAFVIRDIQNVVGQIVMFLMVLSPIAYTMDMVPEAFRTLLWLNPAAWFIVSYQSVVVDGQVPAAPVLTALTLASVGMFVGGFFFFSRVKTLLSNHA